VRTYQIFKRANDHCGHWHVLPGILVTGETPDQAARKVSARVHPEDRDVPAGEMIRIAVFDYAAFARAFANASVHSTQVGSPEREVDQRSIEIMLRDGAPFRLQACGVIE